MSVVVMAEMMVDSLVDDWVEMWAGVMVVTLVEDK